MLKAEDMVLVQPSCNDGLSKVRPSAKAALLCTPQCRNLQQRTTCLMAPLGLGKYRSRFAAKCEQNTIAALRFAV